MPDPITSHSSPRTAAAARQVLLAAVADAVLAVPGVIRLEPTLSTSGPRALLQRSPFDGLHLHTKEGTATVDINLATSTTHQARAVAHQVQTSITDTLL